MSARTYYLITPVILAACCSSCNEARSHKHTTNTPPTAAHKLQVDRYGAIIRGDVSQKEIALVFTGDTFGEGGAVVRTALRENGIPASFFFTGNFYANPSFAGLVKGLKDDGHYLGAHSDKHLLYADWTNRDSTLVTEAEFKQDLLANYERMSSFGISARDAQYFLPAYEWYNANIVAWTHDLGLQLVNFSPGTRSNADYTWPGMGSRYRPSEEIYRSILDREKNDPDGLNGFILLLHIGTDPRRTDKFYNELGHLIHDLRERGYTFVTIDGLLDNG